LCGGGTTTALLPEQTERGRQTWAIPFFIYTKGQIEQLLNPASTLYLGNDIRNLPRHSTEAQSNKHQKPLTLCVNAIHQGYQDIIWIVAARLDIGWECAASPLRLRRYSVGAQTLPSPAYL
jgi:hypothetical protein